MSPLTAALANGLFFNIAWLACVLLRNGWSLVVAVLVMACYLAMEVDRRRAGIVLCVALLIGFAVDNAMLDEGILIPVGSTNLAPFWMTLLWPLFATTLNIAFKGLQQRLLLAAILGAVFAPLSYLAAVRLGAAEFGVQAELALICIGFVWMILFPIGLQFTRRLMRRSPILLKENL